MGTFTIDIENFEWNNGKKDDPEDLCLHGNVVAYIGKVKLEYNATVSATALYLLKTLTENHIINEDNQIRYDENGNLEYSETFKDNKVIKP